MSLVQRGDLAVRLARALEIKGHGVTALDLQPNVVPVVLLDDLTQNQQFLEPKAPGAGCGTTIAAVAAEFSGIALKNPPDSKLVIVVDRILVGLAVAAVVRVGRFNGDPATTYTAQPTFAAWLDSRQAGRPAGMVFTGSDTLDMLQDWWHETRIGAANTVEIFAAQGNPIVLGPGQSMGVVHNTLNSGFNVDIRWKEISAA